jgi:hypothetical protein
MTPIYLRKPTRVINLTGVVWLIIFVVMLAIFQRRLHYEIQAILLMFTRRADITIAIFSLLFLPGVVLHETSHFVSARLLGVRTGRFSIIPQSLQDGRLRMGYVETASTDIVRDSLIGSAPFFVGSAFVLYVTLIPLGFASIWPEFAQGNLIVISDVVGSIYKRPDFWLWFYLVFVVSSTMMPSASDRRAWLSLAVISTLMLIVGLLVWPGNILTETWNLISPKINIGVFALILIFGVSDAIHLILLAPLWLLRKVLMRMLDVQSVY